MEGFDWTVLRVRFGALIEQSTLAIGKDKRFLDVVAKGSTTPLERES
jgi:hypothetical protein